VQGGPQCATLPYHLGRHQPVAVKPEPESSSQHHHHHHPAGAHRSPGQHGQHHRAELQQEADPLMDYDEGGMQGGCQLLDYDELLDPISSFITGGSDDCAPDAAEGLGAPSSGGGAEGRGFLASPMSCGRQQQARGAGGCAVASSSAQQHMGAARQAAPGGECQAAAHACAGRAGTAGISPFAGMAAEVHAPPPAPPHMCSSYEWALHCSQPGSREQSPLSHALGQPAGGLVTTGGSRPQPFKPSRAPAACMAGFYPPSTNMPTWAAADAPAAPTQPLGSQGTHA
jgi:hypothetical protein